MKNLTGPYELAGNTINGDFQFFLNQGPAGQITDNQAQTSRGGLRVVDRIGGNIQFVNNTGGSYETTGNEVNGDIQLFDNRGNGTIRGNTVQGNLQNKQNLPPPTVANNIVSGDAELDESSRTGPMLLFLQDGS